MRYVLQSSADLTSAAAVSSFSVPNDFQLVADGGIAENSDTRYAIRLKAVYQPEEYTVTVILNRPDAAEATGLDGRVIHTDYREINTGTSTELDGVTAVTLSDPGLTFEGWQLYDADDNLLETVAPGETFPAGKFAGKGENFTVRDKWTMNWRIIPHANNSDCTTVPQETTGTIDLYTLGGNANVKASISGNLFTSGYSFEGYSSAVDSTSADVKDGSSTDKVSIDKARFTLSYDETEFIFHVYGQWNKKIRVKFVKSLASSTETWKTVDDTLWLSSLSADFRYTFSPPEETPTTTNYTFGGGWSDVQKQDGVIQNQPPITSIPISDFQYQSNFSRFTKSVYAIWNPVEYTVRYDPYYSIDGNISETNYVPGVEGLTADLDENLCKTVNYDMLKGNGGYNTGSLSAEGYSFLGWNYFIDNRTLFKNPDEIISVTDFNTARSNHDSIVDLKAKWHQFEVYTFQYDLNTEYLEENGGSYIAGSGTLPAWTVTFTEPEINAMGSTITMQMGSGFRAKGFKFVGWRLIYTRYSYNQVMQNTTFENVEDATFEVSKSAAQEANGHLITFKAMWTPYYGAIYDLNLPDGETEDPAFTPVTECYPDDSSTFSSGRESTKFNVGAPARTGYKFLGWSYNKDFFYDAATKSPGSYTQHSDSDNAFCSGLRTSDPWIYINRCTIPDVDCFRAKVYAIWEPLYTYTFVYDLNRPDLHQEGYPQGNYLGKEDDSLSDSNRSGDKWTEVYNENQMIAFRSDPDRFFTSGTNGYLRAKNGLLLSDYFIFRG